MIQTAAAVYAGTGRRKCSVARVRLVPGDGQLIINDRPGDEYLHFRQPLISLARSPLETLGLEAQYNIVVNASGGGIAGQAGAIRLGVARALCELSPENRRPLKIEGYLRRDPRAKERRKYGLKKARKAPQFSKR